jgi:hypothetical protein
MGLAQGNVLSPVIWLLVANSLLVELDSAKIPALGFADDFVLWIQGKFQPVLFDVMQPTLKIVE